jgi:murein DD-endopeptidase MepM/ murein hydrolase activator NlpD
MQHGVDVEVGQWVDQGERIGANGNSGNTQDTPHLHFGVYRAMPMYEEMGVAINFRNAGGPLDTLGGLLANRLYTALPWEE